MADSTELLAELLAWTRISGANALKSLLEQELAKEKDYVAFEATDGKKTQGEVGKAAGLSQPSVSGKWEHWRALGIILDTSGSNKPRHLVKPSALGIKKPNK